MIRTVLFDLEGTLVDAALAHGRALDEVYGILVRFRPKLTMADLERQWAGSLRMNVRGRGGAPASPQAIYRERFKRTLTWLGDEDDNLALRLGRLYASLVLDRAAAYPDARAALAAVGRQALCAVAANGGDTAIRRQLDAAGLAGQIGAVFASQQVGSAKPERELLLAAARSLEASPAQTVVVGDSPDMDGAAAQAAGMPFVWLNRDARRWPDYLPAPNDAVSTLLDLPAVLATL